MTSSAQAAHPLQPEPPVSQLIPGGSGPAPHLLLSGGLLARNSGVGPLLFSAKSMAICMSSTHFSISERELKRRRTSGLQTPAGRRVNG